MGENQKINYLVLQANDNLIKTKIKMQKLKKIITTIKTKC